MTSESMISEWIAHEFRMIPFVSCAGRRMRKHILVYTRGMEFDLHLWKSEYMATGLEDGGKGGGERRIEWDIAKNFQIRVFWTLYFSFNDIAISIYQIIRLIFNIYSRGCLFLEIWLVSDIVHFFGLWCSGQVRKPCAVRAWRDWKISLHNAQK